MPHGHEHGHGAWGMGMGMGMGMGVGVGVGVGVGMGMGMRMRMGMGVGVGVGVGMHVHALAHLLSHVRLHAAVLSYSIAPRILTLLYQRRWSSPSSSCRTVARRASPRTCAMRSSTSSRRTAVVLPGACVRACVLSSVCLSVCAAAGAAHWLDIASL